ncbi:MAG TPA: phosphatidate cytidylyltransferase [Rhodothermales bacterium]|nr:phosphatidate cytidylyltransferase [Rhodothermales bacterium]
MHERDVVTREPESLVSEPPAPEGSAQIPYSAELKRKALHLLALVVPYFMAVNGKPSLLVLAPLALLALLGDYLRARSETFSRFILRLFGFMMRVEEVPPLGGPVKINGAAWVLVTATLLTFIFPVDIAVTALVLFMLADAMAAIVGRPYGVHRWPGTRRTVEGSLAFVATGLLVVAAVPFLAFWVGVVAVMFAAAAEVLPGPLDDNVRVPFTAAAVIFALERFAQGAHVALFVWP